LHPDRQIALQASNAKTTTEKREHLEAIFLQIGSGEVVIAFSRENAN